MTVKLTPDKQVKNAAPLPRVLGLVSAIMLVAGVMIGSGIFKKIAPMAASGLSETQILAAWIVAGIVTMLGAFTVSGLASLTTESGGQFEYLRIIFGNFTAFMFGWSSFTIIGSASIAAIAFIFAQSVNTLFPLYEPLQQLKQFSVAGFIHPFSDSGVKLLAVVTICSLTWVNYRGTKEGTFLNNVVTWCKVAGILLLIVAGLFFAKEHFPVHNATAITAMPAASVYSAFFAAMLSAFWAYDGWLNVSFMSGEIKNPKRNVPLAIISGVLIVMLLYVLINVAYLNVLPADQIARLGENEIVATVMAGEISGDAGVALVAVLILVCTFGSLNGLIITYSRLYHQMATKQMFFDSARQIHPRFQTPHLSLLYSMLMSCLLVFSGTFDMLTDMIIFAGFLFYALLAWGLIKMKKQGKITSGLIAYPVAPMLFIIFSVLLLINTIVSAPKLSLWGLSLMVTGVPFYYYFTRRKH